MHATKPQHIIIILVLTLGLGACAQKPSDEQVRKYKNFSQHVESDPNSQIGLEVAALDLEDGKSAIAPLSNGLDAFAARVSLIMNSKHSIDAQYYILKRDITGELFLAKLHTAAQEGKHVRLLLDDVGSSDMDDLLAALSMHPNFEVRLFNPFYQRSAKFSSMVFDLKRLNGRMHNKSITADNQVTIVGGRNIADVYFSAKDDLEFYDTDVIGFGPIVQDVSTSFDHYWNSDRSYPIEVFIDHEIDPKEQLLGLEQSLANRDIGSYVKRFAKYRSAVANGSLIGSTYECEADLIVDTPSKFVEQEHEKIQLVDKLSDLLKQAEDEIIVSSPYFVPGKEGTDALVEAAESGLDIHIITNSLAATDVAVVHGGYARYRKRLVDAGIHMWEIKPFANPGKVSFIGKGESKSSLHSKFFVVDDKYVFVGSFNWDPRSIDINTEMGVVMQCPQFNQDIHDGLLQKLDQLAYSVRMTDSGNLEWSSIEPSGEERIYTSEPEASFSRKFLAGFSRMLPIESQL